MFHLNTDFLWYEKDKRSALWVKSNKVWREISLSHLPYESFINGDPEIGYEGIRIHIAVDSSVSYVLCDSFGSVPCYTYQNNGITAITTDPFRLFKVLRFIPEYDLKKMLDYFILSYHAIDNRTIYKGLDFASLGVKINLKEISKGDSFNTIFKESDKQSTPADLARELIEIAKVKLAGIDPEKLVLLLTGGKDSLIGALLLKLAIGNVDCATFGFSNSVDLDWSAQRHQKLFSHSKHFTFNIEEFKIDLSDDESYATSMGGFGPYTSIYYETFLQKLNSFGKEYFIFSDHFEAIRKKINDSAYFVENYSTPKEVVQRYFSDQNAYQLQLSNLEKEIFIKFKVDPFYEFYFFDRNSRGMFYKNVLARKHGLAKITLINNADFLNDNFNFIRQTGQFPYDGILDYLLNELGIEDRTWLFPEAGNAKPIPIQPINDLRRVRLHFLALLQGPQTDFIDVLFKREQLISALTTMEIGKDDPWLLLRIYQILIARNNGKNISM